MDTEGAIERLASNIALLCGAVSTLAEAVNGQYANKPAHTDGPVPGPAEPAVPKKRGRPPAATPATTTAPASAPAVVEPDPFAPTQPAPPAASLEDVRNALTALRAATTADQALGVLKRASGVDNLTELQRTPEKYGLVVQAAQAAMPAAAAPKAEVDPFETAPAPTPAKAPTLEDVKAACVAAGKRTGQDKVTAIVMQHGGSAPTAAGPPGPSLKALPAEQYAAVIAAVNALPATK